ncbi:restriction endonuclease subunit S [Pseudoruminococcus massiliensis]|uniref:restriction endonuclease subunit S n=1 Tax=Pseudoruminococcus massiliensis TaxID=2086583 RepID=UPI003993EA8B
MTKEFRPSTSNIVGTDLSKYKIVAQKQFACDFMSTIRVHKMPIAFNTGKEEILVSPAYAVFEVVDEKIILPEYLMMWFSRTEFDRYADFRSDAAIRGGFGWNELCETSISIPCITDQYKIVFEYQAITERIALKQKINDNLAATIQTIFLSCKQSDTFKTYLPLNELVKTVNFRNKDNVYGIDDLMGVSLTKEFIKSPANTISLDVSNYKIVKPFQFACNLMHVGRDKKVAVGMLTDADNVIISPAFTVFEIINNNVILPEVLVSWFSQSFFDNEVSYLASEGIRDGIKWDTFAQIPIFIPEFEIQTKIQNIYKNIQQNKLEISTLNNFADTFITTLSSR